MFNGGGNNEGEISQRKCMPEKLSIGQGVSLPTVIKNFRNDIAMKRGFLNVRVKLTSGNTEIQRTMEQLEPQT